MLFRSAVAEVLNPIDPSLVVSLRDTSALVQRVSAFLALPADERVNKGERYRSEIMKRYPMSAAAASLKSLCQRIAAHS